jgi:XRE family transcriptional regulator, fatty acid utilization regulator
VAGAARARAVTNEVTVEKVFAGSRLRRLRTERGLSQVDMARLLIISPSYLNQIEHDSRPLSAGVLLRVGEIFGVDAAFFAPQDSARRIAELQEALLPDSSAVESAASAVAPADLAQVVASMPELADAVIRLHRQHRSLVETAELVAGSRTGLLDVDPHQEVRDFFYRHKNHFEELDLAGEATAARLGTYGSDIAQGLRGHLEEAYGMTVESLPYGAEREQDLHRYDDERRSLSLASGLRPAQQAFRMATQLAYLEQGALLDRLLDEETFGSAEARQLARIGLANHFAGAVVLPYAAFHQAAENLRYDIELLGEQFGVGYETVAHRLSTLQRPGARGVPFIFVRVDRAGNISKRQSATGFHFSRTGGTCPLWNVYEAFAAPGRVAVQIAAMPDGQRYLWVARTVTRHRGPYGAPVKTFAVGLGCEIRHAARLVYARGMPLDDPAAATPIGPGCRTCQRTDCPQRAAPPLGRRLTIDESRSTFVPYPVDG